MVALMTFNPGAANASLEEITNPDFAFKIGASPKIPICPGFQARVLSVTSVGATRSGGAHGSNEIWANNQVPEIRVKHWPNNGISIENYMRPVDFRAQIEGGVRGFDYSTLAIDKSFIGRIDPAIRLMEQIPVRNAVISACMNRFDLVNVTQNYSVGTMVTLDLGYNIYLNYDGPSGERKSMLVQELRGQTQAQSAFYHVYYDYSPRSLPLVSNSWPKLSGTFGKFMVPTDNQAAAKNLQGIYDLLSQFLHFGEK